MGKTSVSRYLNGEQDKLSGRATRKNRASHRSSGFSS
ncbi:hypothetical protein N5P32_10795 [Marinomonas pontica]|nr:hypothetical protein [Marinomonas pontica]MCW8356358.1 hypothetical protein [Marinomonas pontica]